MEDKCSYVGVYCVGSCEKFFDTYWLGYRFDSNGYYIEEKYYRLSYIFQKLKERRSIYLQF